MYEILAVLAAFAMVYSAVAGRVERTWLSGPIIFVAFGLVIGSHGLQLIGVDTESETLKTLAELTLALVLFTDASGADLSVLSKFRRLPCRLLGIGLPLTIVLGFGIGVLLFPELTVFEVALLATMLAPTDAALGKAVVTNEAVPDPVRQGLNVESGLNDGICVPILFLFLACAAGEHGESPLSMGLELFAEEVGIGMLAGAVLTFVAVVLLKACMRRNWLSPTWTKVTVIAVAFACFGTAQALGGSGFIASFVGGMLFGGLLKPHHEQLLDAAEGIGDSFSLLTWVLFGAALVGDAFGGFTWQVVLYSVLSLTVIRMLPVFVCVTGLKTNTEGKLFVGWFGPRGLASIVFGIIVFDAGVEHRNLLGVVVVCTVLLSIIGHGVTANPWARAFGARASSGGSG